MNLTYFLELDVRKYQPNSSLNCLSLDRFRRQPARCIEGHKIWNKKVCYFILASSFTRQVTYQSSLFASVK